MECGDLSPLYIMAAGRQHYKLGLSRKKPPCDAIIYLSLKFVEEAILRLFLQ